MFDFPQPLRLACGSHRRHTGYACAMNVISWENGDAHITDFPVCVAKPLARMVQEVNDNYCTHSTTIIGAAATSAVSLLCPPCSIDVLALAHRTVGTAEDYTVPVLWSWVKELLVGEFGVVHLANHSGVISYVKHVAEFAALRAEGINTWLHHRSTPLGYPYGTVERHCLALAQTVLSASYDDYNLAGGSPSGGVFLTRVGTQYACVGLADRMPLSDYYGEDSPAKMLAAAHRAVDAWETAARGTPTVPEAAVDTRVSQYAA